MFGMETRPIWPEAPYGGQLDARAFFMRAYLASMHDDPVRRDGENPVLVQAEEHEKSGDERKLLAGGLGAGHGLDRLAGLEAPCN